MGRKHSKHKQQRTTWDTLKERDLLCERHVLLAQRLKFKPGSIQQAYREAEDSVGLSLRDWLEDRHYSIYYTYSPIDELATPESQAEHPAKHSLMPDTEKIMNDYLYDHAIIPGSDDEPEWYSELGELVEEAETNVPITVGDIEKEDAAMLAIQQDYRFRAAAFARRLGQIPEVQRVTLYGSVALPLWREPSRNFRLRSKGIKTFHHCDNINLAVWVSTPTSAFAIREAANATVSDLFDDDQLPEEDNFEYLDSLHRFHINLVQAATNCYLGAACHYRKCPKRNRMASRVKGCGASKFVRVLPWFNFKPDRLNSDNSQVLFERPTGSQRLLP